MCVTFGPVSHPAFHPFTLFACEACVTAGTFPVHVLPVNRSHLLILSGWSDPNQPIPTRSLLLYSGSSTRLFCDKQAGDTCKDTWTHNLYTILYYLISVTLWCLLFRGLIWKKALGSNTSVGFECYPHVMIIIKYQTKMERYVEHLTMLKLNCCILQLWLSTWRLQPIC